MEVWRSTLAKAGLVHSNSRVSVRLAVTKLGVTAISVVFFCGNVSGGKKCLFLLTKGTLGSYQNELGASEIHALFFQPAR